MPGNLCNSYRIKSRRKGEDSSSAEKGTQPQGNWHTHRYYRYIKKYIYTSIYAFYMANTAFDNRMRIRFIVRLCWPYQLHSAPIQRLAFPPHPLRLPVFFNFIFLFFFLVRKPQNYTELPAGNGGGGGAFKPKAKSPEPTESPIPISTYRRLWSC